MSLITKVTLAVSALLALAMAPFCYLNIRAMQQLLHEETVTKADNISETILKTTHYEMLKDDRTQVYQMIQEAGNQEGIDHIRMITKDGKIIFSTNPEERGAYLDKTAAACDMCHAGAQPLREVSSMNRSRVFRGAGGVDVLGLTKAVYNQESCYGAPCHFHPADQNIVGVLDTVVSLERVREQTWAYGQRLVTLTFSMVLLIGASITLLVQYLVNRPVREILRHTKRVGELKLNSQTRVFSNDEIGELAQSVNEMTTSLRVTKGQLEDWAKTLETKVAERTEELRQIQDQLIRSEKLASLGEIVAGIAHELNNPLTGILVLASIMERRPDLDRDLREDLATVVHESKRCARIVKGLLDFSRVNQPQKSLADVNQILENTLALIGTQSIFHDVVFEKDYAPHLPAIMADANQLEQVFINLILNAGQAMPTGGTLRLETAGENGHLRIGISDTGCGIRPEHMQRIFDPFYTTKDTQGTGLGLSVSYGIVENHGGTIEVDSTPGAGTTFTIRIPIGETEVFEAEAAQDTPASGYQQSEPEPAPTPRGLPASA